MKSAGMARLSQHQLACPAVRQWFRRFWKFSMHELGIAASILESVQTEARRHPEGRITKVGVKIGELSGVDRDALQFGFEVLVKDTEWEPVVLDLEYIPRVQRCSKCAHEFRMTEFDP